MRTTARVGGLVRRVLQDLGLEKRVLRQAAVALWPDVVGAQASRHSRAVAVRGEVLMVATRTPVWAHNLTFLKQQLLDRLQERLGARVIEDIRFSSRGWQEPEQPRRTGGTGARSRRLGAQGKEPQQEKMVEEIAARVEDEELRESVVRGLTGVLGARSGRMREGWTRCQACGRIHRSRQKCCACS